MHVEKDDVEIDEYEDGPEGGDDDMDGDNAAPASSAPGRSSPTRGRSATEAAEEPPKKKKVVVSYDKYMTITNLVIMQLNTVEQETNNGLPKAELIQWYLEQREADLNTVEELEEEQLLIEKVLKKLVKEKQLLELRGEVQESEEPTEDSTADDVILMVHPGMLFFFSLCDKR